MTDPGCERNAELVGQWCGMSQEERGADTVGLWRDENSIQALGNLRTLGLVPAPLGLA